MRHIEIVEYSENLTCADTAERLKYSAKCLIGDIRSRFGVNRLPHLVIITDGEDKASATYLRNKTRVCKDVGIRVTVLQTDIKVLSDLEKTIKSIADWKGVDGIIVQLPLAKFSRYDVYQVLDSSLPPSLDVDGLTSFSQARCTAFSDFTLSYREFLSQNPRGLDTTNIVSEGLICPCTAGGILAYMQAQTVKDEDFQGNRALIINRSRLIGLPLQTMLTQKGMTVTVAHSKTANLPELVKQFNTANDWIITAVGKENFILPEVSGYPHVIDAAIFVESDGKLRGDVNRYFAQQSVSRITPVPGGVGKLTCAMLALNTAILYAYHHVAKFCYDGDALVMPDFLPVAQG